MQSDPQRSMPFFPVLRRLRTDLAVFVLIAMCCLVELILGLADHGFIGTPRWRGLAYQNGAFWAGLLGNWRPNYDLQPWTMFLSYAFLHAGTSHLLGNMLTLLALGPNLIRKVGQGRFLLIYTAGALGGAFGFLLLGSPAHPVVGASGALFGLAGALIHGDWADRRRAGRPVWPALGAILFLMVLNLVLWISLDGLLAWEAHLGGFVLGWLAAAVLWWVWPADGRLT